MHKITLTVGHNVGPVELLDSATICNTAADTLGVDAFTAIPCVGMWRGMGENSTRLEIVTDEDSVPAIVERVPELARRLNQEAIMCEVSVAAVEFPAAAPVAA